MHCGIFCELILYTGMVIIFSETHTRKHGLSSVLMGKMKQIFEIRMFPE